MTTSGVPAHAFYATADEAKADQVQGWNLRCNLCGSYGADWHSNERPGWGDLALCPTHGKDLTDENRRHDTAIAELRRINYEQDR